jgi:hypothetical protein
MMVNDTNFIYSNSKVRQFAIRYLAIVDYIKIFLLRPKIIIHGSYYTTNIGDRAIAIVLKGELSQNGIKAVLVSRFCTNPPTYNIVVGGGGIIHNQYKENLYLRTNFINDEHNVISSESAVQVLET